jgi:hypothetical protein
MPVCDTPGVLRRLVLGVLAYLSSASGYRATQHVATNALRKFAQGGGEIGEASHMLRFTHH